MTGADALCVGRPHSVEVFNVGQQSRVGRGPHTRTVLRHAVERRWCADDPMMDWHDDTAHQASTLVVEPYRCRVWRTAMGSWTA